MQIARPIHLWYLNCAFFQENVFCYSPVVPWLRLSVGLRVGRWHRWRDSAIHRRQRKTRTTICQRPDQHSFRQNLIHSGAGAHLEFVSIRQRNGNQIHRNWAIIQKILHWDSLIVKARLNETKCISNDRTYFIASSAANVMWTSTACFQHKHGTVTKSVLNSKASERWSAGAGASSKPRAGAGAGLPSGAIHQADHPPPIQPLT